MAENRPRSIPAPNAGGLDGKMIYTNGKVSDMPNPTSTPLDATRQNSQRGNEASTQKLRENEADRENTGAPFGNTASPDGDSAGENRVTTSFDKN